MVNIMKFVVYIWSKIENFFFVKIKRSSKFISYFRFDSNREISYLINFSIFFKKGRKFIFWFFIRVICDINIFIFLMCFK